MIYLTIYLNGGAEIGPFKCDISVYERLHKYWYDWYVARGPATYFKDIGYDSDDGSPMVISVIVSSIVAIVKIEVLENHKSQEV